MKVIVNGGLLERLAGVFGVPTPFWFRRNLHLFFKAQY